MAVGDDDDWRCVCWWSLVLDDGGSAPAQRRPRPGSDTDNRRRLRHLSKLTCLVLPLLGLAIALALAGIAFVQVLSSRDNACGVFVANNKAASNNKPKVLQFWKRIRQAMT